MAEEQIYRRTEKKGQKEGRSAPRQDPLGAGAEVLKILPSVRAVCGRGAPRVAWRAVSLQERRLLLWLRLD